eukprot:gene7040-9615_t
MSNNFMFDNPMKTSNSESESKEQSAKLINDQNSKTNHLKFQSENSQRKIYMYIYIKAVTDVDCKSQNFHMQFHQYLQWAPTHKEYADFMENPSEYSPAFKPNLPPSNARVIESVEEETCFGDSNSLHVLTKGKADVWGQQTLLSDDDILFGLSRKYVAIVGSGFNLRSFPCDYQSLHVFFESMLSTNEMILLPVFTKDECLDIELGTMPSSPEFEFLTPIMEFNAFGEPPNPAFACCTLTIKLARRLSGFFFRVVLPVAMVNLINLSVFFYDPSDLNSRLSVIITLLLTMIAFQYVISEAIPSVPYTTLADLYIGVTYVSFVLLIFYCCIGSAVQISSINDSRVGLAYLGMYLVIQTVFCCLAFMAWEEGKRTLHMGYTEICEQQLLGEEASSISVAASDAQILYTEEHSKPMYPLGSNKKLL